MNERYVVTVWTMLPRPAVVGSYLVISNSAGEAVGVLVREKVIEANRKNVRVERLAEWFEVVDSEVHHHLCDGLDEAISGLEMGAFDYIPLRAG